MSKSSDKPSTKFKVGDRVVFIKDDTQLKFRTNNGLLGKSFVISGYDEKTQYYYTNDPIVGRLTNYYEDWIEHEHIYNSRLYKALQEPNDEAELL